MTDNDIITTLEIHSDTTAWLNQAEQALSMAMLNLNRLPEAHERNEITNAVQDSITELNETVEAIRRMRVYVAARAEGIAKKVAR